MSFLSAKFNFERTENTLSKLLTQVKEKESYIDLTSANPTLFFNYNLEKIKSALIEKSFFPYNPNPQGLTEARLSLVDYYKRKGRDMDSDLFFLTSGTSEAMSFIIKAICDPESEIILPTPGYPLYDFIFILEKINSKNYSFVPKNTETPNKLLWEIDFNSLIESINKKTKAIVIVEPHNPTGSRLTQYDAERIAELARAHNLVLIIDEVFSDYYDGYYLKNYFEGANCLYLNGLSKTLALPQMKLSWIYLKGDLNFLRQMKEGFEIICDTYLSVNIPVQVGLGELLETSDGIQKIILERIKANCHTIKELLQNKDSIEYYLPDGGWHMILKLKNFSDDEEFACSLLGKQLVYVHPGYMFDIENGCYIVISLILPEKVFREGIQRIIFFLRDSKEL